MKENTNHRNTSIKLDERKLLLKMAKKEIVDYYDLAEKLGFSKCVISTGFNQNQGFFGKKVCKGLCLLLGCTMDDLRADEIVIPERKYGQQGTASKEEASARAATGNTQGRKGCKATRINMNFYTDNHRFITYGARCNGMTMTRYLNLVLNTYRMEHPAEQALSDAAYQRAIALAGKEVNA